METLYENHVRESFDLNAIDKAVKLGYDAIGSHIQEHISYLYDSLKALHYSNGQPMVKLFGPKDFSKRGGNIIRSFC